MLYAAGKPKITLADAQEVVSAETVAGRLGGDQRDPERQRRGGAAPARRWRSRRARVPYMILGQLAWFVRDKLSTRPAAHSRARSTRCSGRTRPEEFRGIRESAGTAGRGAVRRQRLRPRRPAA